jgi:hypothetical protein
MKSLYGLSQQRYLTLLSCQDGLCAICGKTNTNGKYLSVDHDHSTGEVRALLCNPCNLMIGNARENTETLRRAALYLEVYCG